MGALSEAQFTVALRRRNDGRWRYIVTCERCCEDLSDEYSAHAGPTVIRIEGLEAMTARSPEAALDVRERLTRIWDEAVSTRRPMVLDMRHDITQLQDVSLERAIELHAEECCK